MRESMQYLKKRIIAFYVFFLEWQPYEGEEAIFHFLGSV